MAVMRNYYYFFLRRPIILKSSTPERCRDQPIKCIQGQDRFFGPKWNQELMDKLTEKLEPMSNRTKLVVDSLQRMGQMACFSAISLYDYKSY